MSDISKCTAASKIDFKKRIDTSSFCPLRMSCKRYTIAASKYQSYIEAPYDVEKKECEMYYKLDK